MQADLNLRLALMFEGTFSDVAAYVMKISATNTLFSGPKIKMDAN